VNHLASWTSVTSGVPQGSVLGPLLLSLFVNDLLSIVSSPLALFTDDTKIYSIRQWLSAIAARSWQHI